MKSVNFWLPPNLIKHVDEAFRGTAGSQEKRDLGSGDQGTESVGARDLWRGDGWGHCDVSSVCACVCVSAVQMANSVPGIFFTWSPSVRSFYRKLEDVQVYSAGQSQVTWSHGSYLQLKRSSSSSSAWWTWMMFVIKWVSLIEACLYCRDQIIMACIAGSCMCLHFQQ